MSRAIIRILPVCADKNNTQNIKEEVKQLLKIYHTPPGYIFLIKIFKVPVMSILYSLTEEGLHNILIVS